MDHALALLLFSICAGALFFAVALSLWKGAAWWWSFSRAQRLILVACWALSVGASVYVLRKHDLAQEPTWHPKARHWPRVPLGVAYRESDLGPHVEGLREAIRGWNKAAGCRLFEERAHAPDVRVRTFDGAPCGSQDAADALEDDAAGGAWLCPDGTADVQFVRLDRIDVAYRRIAHDMGHVLGLAHSARIGIMVSHPDSVRFVEPNATQARAIRERYCSPAPGSGPGSAGEPRPGGDL